MKVEIGRYGDNDEPRSVKVQFCDDDFWNLDHTLAMVIYPALLKFRQVRNSYPKIDPNDLPSEWGRTPECEASEEDYDYVLDEMIYSFRSKVENWDVEPERVKNGLRLFAKYFSTLWR